MRSQGFVPQGSGGSEAPGSMFGIEYGIWVQVAFWHAFTVLAPAGVAVGTVVGVLIAHFWLTWVGVFVGVSLSGWLVGRASYKAMDHAHSAGAKMMAGVYDEQGSE